MSEENKAVVRRWVQEVQTAHRFEVMDELFEPDIVNHDRPGGLPSPQGVDGIREFFEAMIGVFPDFKAAIQDQIAEGDKVVTLKMVSGTHQGGIPRHSAHWQPVRLRRSVVRLKRTFGIDCLRPARGPARGT
jgi:predicted ester cyclase